MKLRFIIFMATNMFLLSGCLYETNKALTPKPFDSNRLDQAETFRIPYRNNYHSWWSQFGDPQLSQLIEIGLQESPNINIAQNRIRRANALVNLTASTLLPTIDLIAYTQRQRFSKYGLVPPPFNGKIFNINDVGLNFNYEFDFWGKNRNKVFAQLNEKFALITDLAMARLILSSSIAQLYFELQGYLKQLSIAKEIYQDQKSLLNIIKARTKNGIQSDIPVNKAMISAQNALLTVRKYEEKFGLAKNQLNILLGKNPFRTQVKYPKFKFHQYSYQLPKHLSAKLLANRPDILASRYRTEAASHLINVSKASFFPNINLMGLFSYQSIIFQKLFNPASQNNYFNAALDLPIFDAGARFANLSSKYAEYAITVSIYNQTILNALKEVCDRVVILRSLKSQLSTNFSMLNATKANEKLLRLHYRHGISDYEQVILIHQRFLQQKSLQINLQTQYMIAIVGLYKALGGYEG